MKKTSIFFAIATIALLSACRKENFNATESTPGAVTVIGVGINDVKTTMGAPVEGTRKIYWANGDKLQANDLTSAALADLPEKCTSARFTFDDTLNYPANLLYPADYYKDESTITLPLEQPVTPKVALYGYMGEEGDAQMSALLAYVHIPLTQGEDKDEIKAMTVESLTDGYCLSGDFTINYETGALTPAAEASKKVSVLFNKPLNPEKATDFFAAVPAGENVKLSVKFRDSQGHCMTKTVTRTFAAGTVTSLPDTEFVPTTTEFDVVITTAAQLVQFAKDYNDGKFNNPIVQLGSDIVSDIVFDETTSAQFNETGGIGTPDNGHGGTNYFNGVFDGNNHTISGLKATVPLFAYVGANGRIEYLTLTETCSFDYSSAIAEDKSLGSIAGYSEGDLFNCVNKADVSCSSARTAGVLNIGGVVGRQYATGTISNCANYGSVTCTVDGSSDIYMGGIAGTVERPSSGHTALIKDCDNYGDVKNGIDSSEPAQSCFLHIGGVVGWIYSTSSSANMEISGLINTGNVTKTNNSARADAIAVLVGGIVGGIHGASISDRSGTVAIKNSHVMNCRVQTGSFNNRVGYGEASHVGGFVAVARGNESSKNISFSDDCYVKDVYVICRRGFAGGFVSWARGAVFSGCHVLSSSVRGSLANCYFAGGIAGCAYDCNLSDCIVLLTKEDSAGAASDSYTLFAKGNNNMAGGIVAQARGTVSIDGCKAYVKNIVQGDSGNEAYRGWIIGYIEDDAGITIKDCAIGGASTSATTITLDADNFDDDHNNHTYGYFYGSKGTNGTVTFTGTQSYWEVIKTADITIASYATDHDWKGGEFYSIEQGDVTLTPLYNGENPNGVYTIQWRFYQARGGGLTISVSGGHTLVRATFTYDSSNGGVLLAPDGDTQIFSGGSCNLSGTSAFFTLGNTGDKTNGQVRFTRIVVEYTNSPFINK
ncbi:MAG: hypothetical protein MJY55_01895 [Bacteroidales bacterium]|nr:hypothetical protein [Bacteroidales bacterium]